MFPTQTRLEQVLIHKEVEGKIQECQTVCLLATAENSPELFGDFPGISSDEIANIPHCNVLVIGAGPAILLAKHAVLVEQLWKWRARKSAACSRNKPIQEEFAVFDRKTANFPANALAKFHFQSILIDSGNAASAFSLQVRP